jgi:myo-inositol 2-dehydrogenase/D-chiro-inositol 1-dehydrogenase
MITPSVRIAMIGVGRIGRMHAGLVAGPVPETVLVAVADANAEAASAVAAEFGVEALTLDEILARPDIDAVGVTTSTNTHVETIVAAARAGKAIMCEKPISMEIHEVDRALAAVDEAGVAFMVGFNRRFDPSHAAVREAVAAGRIGQVEIVRITSRDPEPPPMSYIAGSGGLFLDMMVHDFDMAPFIVGSPVVSVYAQGAVRVDQGFADNGDIDTAIVLLTHADGTLTSIDNSRRAAYGYDQRVEAFGSLGMVASENVRLNTTTVTTAAGTIAEPLQPWFIGRYADAYRIEWSAFADYVRGGGPSPVSGREARSPLVIAAAANLSLVQNRPVTIAEIEHDLAGGQS